MASSLLLFSIHLSTVPKAFKDISIYDLQTIINILLLFRIAEIWALTVIIFRYRLNTLALIHYLMLILFK